MPRTNHRVITTVFYAAEIRSLTVWFNSGLRAIARKICHAPVKLRITAIIVLSSHKLVYGYKTGLKAIPRTRNIGSHARDNTVMQIDQHR